MTNFPSKLKAQEKGQAYMDSGRMTALQFTVGKGCSYSQNGAGKLVTYVRERAGQEGKKLVSFLTPQREINS